jgi:hypothetical protein
MSSHPCVENAKFSIKIFMYSVNCSVLGFDFDLLKLDILKFVSYLEAPWIPKVKLCPWLLFCCPWEFRIKSDESDSAPLAVDIMLKMFIKTGSHYISCLFQIYTSDYINTIS